MTDRPEADDVVDVLRKLFHEAGSREILKDFIELYDAAHAVIDKIRIHVDHAEYEGSMNAVEDFREISARLYWKHTKSAIER